MAKDWSNDPERIEVALWFSGEFDDELRLAELPSGKFVIRDADGNTVGSHTFNRPGEAKAHIEKVREDSHERFMDHYVDEASEYFYGMLYEGRDPAEVTPWCETQEKAVKSGDPQEMADTFGEFGEAVEFMRRHPREDY